MFDHFVAVDWSQVNMAIARHTKESKIAKVIDVPSDIHELRVYLDQLKGKKIITFEETTSAQWLYTELKDHADEVIVCDPYRNRLLSEGAKNDRIDACKLADLLRASLRKPVFHTWDELFYLRKLVSGYEDVIRAGVRAKNQRSALIRAAGVESGEELKGKYEQFVLSGIDRAIDQHNEEKRRYLSEFEAVCKKHALARCLTSVPGIAHVHAVKIFAAVLNPRRFPNKGNFLAYCGLFKHEKISGGRSYGKRNPRFSRSLKCVFKTAAVVCLKEGRDNIFRSLFSELISKRQLPAKVAQHMISRRIAILAWGVMKSGKPLDQGRWISPQPLQM